MTSLIIITVYYNSFEKVLQERYIFVHNQIEDHQFKNLRVWLKDELRKKS